MILYRMLCKSKAQDFKAELKELLQAFGNIPIKTLIRRKKVRV